MELPPRCRRERTGAGLSKRLEGRRDDEDDGKKKWIHSATIGAVAEEMGREEKVEGERKMEEEDGRGKPRTDRRIEEGRTRATLACLPARLPACSSD